MTSTCSTLALLFSFACAFSAYQDKFVAALWFLVAAVLFAGSAIYYAKN